MKYAPYSITKINAFKQCPRLFKYKYIEKIKEPLNMHFERGDFAHQLIESVLQSVKYKQKKPFSIMTPEEVSATLRMVVDFCKGDLFKKIIGLAKKYPFYVEQTLSLNSEYQPVDRWRGNPFIIGKIDLEIDAGETFKIIDWKTGKKPNENFEKDMSQLDIYALNGLLKYGKPGRASFVYIEHNHVVKKDYTLEDVVPIQRTFTEYARQIEAEKDFMTKESALCKTCAYFSLCPAYN